MVLHPLRTKLESFNNNIYFHVYSLRWLFSITFENHKIVPNSHLKWIIPNSNLQEEELTYKLKWSFCFSLVYAAPNALTYCSVF